MRLLFSFSLGSEVRQFCHSGVISDILDQGHSVLIASPRLPEQLIDQVDERACLVEMPRDRLPGLYLLLQKALDATHDAKSSWNYMGSTSGSTPGLKGVLIRVIHGVMLILCSCVPLRGLLLRLERWLQRHMRYSNWDAFYAAREVDRVIVNVSKSNSAGLYAAAKRNIPVLLAYHTNKDVYASCRMSYDFAAYGVWNADMKAELLRTNTSLDSSSVEVIGCSHFSYLSNSAGQAPKGNMPRAQGDRRQVLFIASAPFAVKHEHKYLLLLKEVLIDLVGEAFQIVVRVNPMDDTVYWDEYRESRVLISKPRWYWRDGFNFVLRDDLKLYSQLLHDADCIVGFPSTVVLEAAIVQRPCVNFVFDLPGFESVNGPSKSLWEAPFYQKVVALGAAIPAHDRAGLKRCLWDIFTSPLKTAMSRHQAAYVTSELTHDVPFLRQSTVTFCLRDLL